MKKTSILLIMFAFCCNIISAKAPKEKANWKTQFIVGANVTFEGRGEFSRTMGGEAVNPKVTFSPGISFEARFSKHSGIETGLHYRYLDFSGATKTYNNDIYHSWNENYLSLPILYKFSSRILNFAVGPTFDFLIGSTLPAENKVIYGGLIKLTKDIKLYKGLFVEPYLQSNIQSSYVWWGGGVGLKYRF